MFCKTAKINLMTNFGVMTDLSHEMVFLKLAPGFMHTLGEESHEVLRYPGLEEDTLCLVEVPYLFLIFNFMGDDYGTIGSRLCVRIQAATELKYRV